MLQKYSGLISEWKIESCARFNLRFSFLWSSWRTQMFLISNKIQTKATTFCFFRYLLLLKNFSIFFVWSLFRFNIISCFEIVKPLFFNDWLYSAAKTDTFLNALSIAGVLLKTRIGLRKLTVLTFLMINFLIVFILKLYCADILVFVLSVLE